MAHRFSKELLASLMETLRYEPETGNFYWLVRRNSHAGPVNPGDVAGGLSDQGYVIITVDGARYRASILAWWFMTGGPVPSGLEIDHENRTRCDNRWTNLRPIGRGGNNHNREAPRNNRSGMKGVSWASKPGKWDARITVDGDVIVLGRFVDFQDAVEARLRAEKIMLGETQTRVVPNAPAAVFEKMQPRLKTTEEIGAAHLKKSLTKRTTNTSGHPGVRLHKQSGRWHARIVVNYKEISLGYFRSFDEAVCARRVAEKKYLGLAQE